MILAITKPLTPKCVKNKFPVFFWKFDKLVFPSHYTVKRLNAAQLQHLLEKPRDGSTPPKVTIFLKRGLQWH